MNVSSLFFRPLRMHAKEIFLTTLKQGFAQELEEERESHKVEGGFLNPLKKGLDPSATGSIFRTLPRNFGSEVFPVEIATLSPRWLRQETLEIFLIFSPSSWQGDKWASSPLALFLFVFKSLQADFIFLRKTPPIVLCASH